MDLTLARRKHSALLPVSAEMCKRLTMLCCFVYLPVRLKTRAEGSIGILEDEFAVLCCGVVWCGVVCCVVVLFIVLFCFGFFHCVISCCILRLLVLPWGGQRWGGGGGVLFTSMLAGRVNTPFTLGMNGVEIAVMWNSMLICADCAPCKVLVCRICSEATYRNYKTMGCVHFPKHTSCIFLWLPDRTEDRSGLVGKIATCWAKIGSRVWKGGRNDGLDGFLRFNNILKKSSKTGFRDR